MGEEIHMPGTSIKRILASVVAMHGQSKLLKDRLQKVKKQQADASSYLLSRGDNMHERLGMFA
jgi:hypothetical protein